MGCPNCGTSNTWDDVSAWVCNKCGWCSLAWLNSTRTPSGHADAKARARDWAKKDREKVINPAYVPRVIKEDDDE